MEDTILDKDIITKTNLESYFKTHDTSFLHENAVFRNMATGEVTNGRQAIGEMLHHIYHVAFDARLDVTNYFISGDKAAVEGFFTGKHTGELNGVPASQKQVKVPIAVTYELEDSLIREARIYLLVHIMMDQLTK